MKGVIKLSYRKIIDSQSTKAWDKAVWESTYLEFFMQAQQFDQSGQSLTFQEILDNNPRADQMHYLVSTAAMSYLKGLKFIPDIINTEGVECLTFQNFKFEIIQSHTRQKELHQIAITFYSDALTWIDTVHNHFLVTYGDMSQSIKAGQEVATDLIPLQDNLSVAFFKAHF